MLLIERIVLLFVLVIINFCGLSDYRPLYPRYNEKGYWVSDPNRFSYQRNFFDLIVTPRMAHSIHLNIPPLGQPHANCISVHASYFALIRCVLQFADGRFGINPAVSVGK